MLCSPNVEINSDPILISHETTGSICRTKVADSISNLSFLILYQRMKQFFLRQAKNLAQEENRAITNHFLRIFT